MRTIAIVILIALASAACTSGSSDETTTTTDATTTSEEATTTSGSSATTSTAANEAPVVEIIAPADLSTHAAALDPDRDDIGALITFTATVGDPDGDPVEVEWSSSLSGILGTGESIDAWISTDGSDASQPVITATATDQRGAETSASIQILVWIPSDT